MRRLSALLLLAAALAVPGPAASQDVEMLAEHYGTPLPEAYFRTRAALPGAFEFSRGRAVRLRERLASAGFPQVRLDATRVDPLAILGPRDGPVAGTFRIPVLMGLFSDSPGDTGPFARDAVQEAYFGPGAGTITAYYGEVSGGKVDLPGDVTDWIRADVTQSAATGGSSGLAVGTTGAFITDLLRKMPPDTDWGRYDNDGPDGVPNSGDDDGFVDVLAVLHPTSGAECGGVDKDNRIWSHRWSLRASARATFITTTPAAGGGFIKIDDYVVQPIRSCGGSGLNEIGVFTHELGHAFGLPDLYDTDDRDGKHQGAGNWDLMATGSWGCNGSTPYTPCHMSAWSKAVLGWADVETLPQGTDLGTLVLPPVMTTGKVFRIDAADGSGDYFLLENRQRLGFDSFVYGEGMLVWRISQRILDQRWSSNGVNASSRLGVWLREADGLNELATPGCPRGNAGDPFPFVGPLTGCKGVRVEGENRVFHAASNPSSLTDDGNASGLTLLDIRKEGRDVTFRVSTRFTRIAVRSEGDGGTGGLFTVNGAPRSETGFSFTAAPFLVNTVEAAAGESLGQGVRRPFTGWSDDPEAPRARTVETPLDDIELVARYGGEQYEISVALTGGQGDIAPGTFSTQPAASDLWFPAGTAVTLEAKPRQGFRFLRWTGALEGAPNPTSVVVDHPIQAGADFELTYRVAETTVTVSAAEDPQLTLVPENGTAPYVWKILQGTLPTGLTFSEVGRIAGAAMETGTFPLTVEVSDFLGLKAQGAFTLQVDEARIPAAALASRFLQVGPALTPPQLQYLDQKGNGNGVYDLGDFRAWVLANPGLSLTAAMKALVGPRTVVVPMQPVGEQREERR